MENPSIFAWEIRKKLADERVFKLVKVPSVSSVNRILRKIQLDTGMLSGEFLAHNSRYTVETPTQDVVNERMEIEADNVTEHQHRNRTAFTHEQCRVLEQEFSRNQYADMFTREKLASGIQLPEETIKVWFSNRRAKWRRETSHMSSDHVSHNSTPMNQKNEDVLLVIPMTTTKPITQQTQWCQKNGSELQSDSSCEMSQSYGSNSRAESGVGGPEVFSYRDISIPLPSSNTQYPVSTSFPSIHPQDERPPLAESLTYPLAHRYTDVRTIFPLAHQTERTGYLLNYHWNEAPAFPLAYHKMDERFLLAHHREIPAGPFMGQNISPLYSHQ
ncbi:hypothetical protein UPYG_G00348440 [Umbra pygmaea]|uniref:Uncharacterized protein n=1 Tax=Umbra pygmaea TaxID=75934 RepID=A0ABD0VYP5_UMBPY